MEPPYAIPSNTASAAPPAAAPITPVVVTSGQGLWFNHTPPLTAEQVRLIVRDELERALAPSVEKAYGGTD